MADNKEDRGPPPPPVSTVRISKNLAVDMDPVSALTTEQPSLVWARAVEVVVPPPIPVQHNAPPPADSASDAPPPDPARRESSPRRRKYIWILGLAGLTIVLLIIIVLYFANLSNQVVVQSDSQPSSAVCDDRSDLRAIHICEYINGLNLSGEPLFYPVRDLQPSHDEKALSWLIDQDPIKLQLYDQKRLGQRFALASLWFHTDQSPQSNIPICDQREESWSLDSNSECDWFGGGVKCTESGMVSELRFGWDSRAGFDALGYMTLRCFAGKIPSNIGLLTSLSVLSMNGQDFSKSSIPDTIYDLSSLEVLGFASSVMEGSISSSITKLSNLKVLDFSRNAMFGEIPPVLGMLTTLEELRFDFNQFSGTIPTSILSLSHLTHLLLHENSLTGTLPTEFGLAAALVQLELHGNPIRGTIPAELTALANLTKFHAFNTQLTGPNPLCSTSTDDDDNVYTNLIVDCHRVDCPCCTSCCDEETIGDLVCGDGGQVCQIRDILCVLTDWCDGDYPEDVLGSDWGSSALACSCECRG